MSAASSARPRIELPIFPLGAVLFPQGVLPLKVFEQRYLDMTRDCLRDNAPFGVCAIREGQEVGVAALPEETGCTAVIASWDMPHLGLFQLQARGETIFRILEQWVQPNGLVRATVELAAPQPEVPIPHQRRLCAQLLEKLIERLGASRFPAPIRLDDAGWVSFRLAEILPLTLESRQHVLETADPLARLDTLHSYLERQG